MRVLIIDTVHTANRHFVTRLQPAVVFDAYGLLDGGALRHLLPDRINVWPIQISCTIPAPAPHCKKSVSVKEAE